MHLLSQINRSFLLLFITILSDTKYSDCDQVDEEDSMQYSRSMMVSLRYDCEHKGNSTTHCCSRTILTELFILTQADVSII